MEREEKQGRMAGKEAKLQVPTTPYAPRSTKGKAHRDEAGALTNQIKMCSTRFSFVLRTTPNQNQNMYNLKHPTRTTSRFYVLFLTNGMMKYKTRLFLSSVAGNKSRVVFKCFWIASFYAFVF